MWKRKLSNCVAITVASLAINTLGGAAFASSKVTVHNCENSHHSVRVESFLADGALGESENVHTGSQKSLTCYLDDCILDFSTGGHIQPYTTSAANLYVHVKSNKDFSIHNSNVCN